LQTSSFVLDTEPPGPEGLTARQRSEIDYHSSYAARHACLVDTPVDLDVVTSARRRPWNAYWAFYDLMRATDLRGKRVLVPGCGFGEDALRLTECGAEVHGIDLSPEIVDMARRRAQNFAPRPVTINVMPSERITYPDDFFDAVVLVNILHHVDIPPTMAEVRRVAKPGAHILGLEMYTHSLSQRLHESALMTKVIYPRVVGKIYDGAPYITPDERKINEPNWPRSRGGLRTAGWRISASSPSGCFPAHTPPPARPITASRRCWAVSRLLSPGAWCSRALGRADPL